MLVSRKFDAVIFDCDDLPGGIEILQALRKTRSNQSSVAFAILNGTTTQKAFELGANFVLQKPLTTLNATRCFNAALSFMARERRRYFRHPIEMPVKVVFTDGRELMATTTNISEGGMSVRCRGKLPKATGVMLKFSLPGSSSGLELKGEVAWIDDLGRAGIRFAERELGVDEEARAVRRPKPVENSQEVRGRDAAAVTSLKECHIGHRRTTQQAVRPPSTVMTCPHNQRASLERRNSTAAAISAPSPGPRG